MKLFTLLIFGTILTIAVSCRKDELVIIEDIVIQFDGTENPFPSNSSLIKNKGAYIFSSPEDNAKVVIDLGEKKMLIGDQVPSSVLISFITNPLDDLILNIEELGLVGDFHKGTLSGTIREDSTSSPFVMSFNIKLEDVVQQICGVIWYDTNEDNLFDSFENGVNGLTIQSEVNGDVWSSCKTGRNPIAVADDGYFELDCSTTYSNKISIINLPPSLKMVDPNIGNDPSISSAFDENGMIINLEVIEGDKLQILGGTTPQ